MSRTHVRSCNDSRREKQIEKLNIGSFFLSHSNPLMLFSFSVLLDLGSLVKINDKHTNCSQMVYFSAAVNVPKGTEEF